MIQDGINGFLVEPENSDGLAKAIMRAIADDDLIDIAAISNAKVIRERLSRSKIRDEVIGLYEKVFDRTGSKVEATH